MPTMSAVVTKIQPRSGIVATAAARDFLSPLHRTLAQHHVSARFFVDIPLFEGRSAPQSSGPLAVTLLLRRGARQQHSRVDSDAMP